MAAAKVVAGLGIALAMVTPSIAQTRITISSEWGRLDAELADNPAARALAGMLPLSIDMRDHLRQEKTGNLPSSLPETTRQRAFNVGTLGVWGPNHFVIYYRAGQVPNPGIIILGQVTGDVGILDRPGGVMVRVERSN